MSLCSPLCLHSISRLACIFSLSLHSTTVFIIAITFSREAKDSCQDSHSLMLIRFSFRIQHGPKNIFKVRRICDICQFTQAREEKVFNIYFFSTDDLHMPWDRRGKCILKHLIKFFILEENTKQFIQQVSIKSIIYVNEGFYLFIFIGCDKFFSTNFFGTEERFWIL